MQTLNKLKIILVEGEKSELELHHELLKCLNMFSEKKTEDKGLASLILHWRLSFAEKLIQDPSILLEQKKFESTLLFELDLHLLEAEIVMDEMSKTTLCKMWYPKKLWNCIFQVNKHKAEENYLPLSLLNTISLLKLMKSQLINAKAYFSLGLLSDYVGSAHALKNTKSLFDKTLVEINLS